MKHLLIVEDDKIDQMAFERFAEKENFPFKYQLVSSISEAKQALKNNSFDAILTDYFLGDGTMFEILDLKPNLPVVVTTGTGNELIAVKAIQKGAFDYLIKDIEGHYLKLLSTTIAKAIDHFEIKKKNLAYQLNLEQLVQERTKNLKLEIAKSKILEDSLRAERDKFNFILEALPIGVSVLDTENKVTYINQKSFEIEGNLEHTQKIVGKTIQSIHTKQSQEKITELLSGFKSGKQSVAIRETKRNHKDVEISYHAIKDSKGIYSGILRLVSDITERKTTELINKVIYNITKKASEKGSIKKLFDYIQVELGTLTNTDNFFIALYDKKTDLISTPYMVDELDEGKDFPKGKTLTGYVIDTKKSLLANPQEFLNLRQSKKVEMLGPQSKCWLGVPILINNEAIGALVIQSYTDENAYSEKDVTLLELVASNMSQAIKKMRDFEKINLLNQALFQSDEAVIITNLNGDIEFVNSAFTNLSGYSEQDVLGKNPRILKSGEQPTEYYENLWNTVLGGVTWSGEFINKRKDDSKYLVKANISPVKNNKSEITHFIGIQENITEKRKLERDFIHAFIDAQEQEKQSFGEDLHDGISQILAAESMYVQVLKGLVKSDDIRIKDALEKIEKLNLSAITDARNIAHGLMSKQLKEVGLLKAVENICVDYSEARNIAFKFIHSGLKEEDFNKDVKTNLFRIIQEVSTNTIRHSLAKTMNITLTRLDENTIKLVLKDDGVGIDFEKMKRENKGAGLKNVERRVTLLNGKTTLDSAPNKGTCYTIIVPLQTVR